MEPIISVIIPIYNCELYIFDCLNSVVNQTLKELEIICVNDGSTDSSVDIVKKFMSKDNRIKLINQDNQGLGCARNAGIRIAKGEYVAFVDSDDFIKDIMLEEMYKRAKHDDSDVVVSNPYIYDNISHSFYPYRNMLEFYRLSCLGGFKANEKPEVLQFIGCWDKIYRNAFLKKYNLFNPEKRIYEDFLFTYKTLVLANKISFVKDSYYFYRKFAGGSITDKESKEDEYKIDFIKNLEEGQNFLIEHNCFKDFEKTFISFFIFWGKFHFFNIRKKKVKNIFIGKGKTILKKCNFDLITGIAVTKEDKDFINIFVDIRFDNYDKVK